MSKSLCILGIAAALLALRLEAQLGAALPADRFALANQLSRRGLYEDAVKEYEAVLGDKSLPRDELRYRLGEAYRKTGRAAQARKIYSDLIKDSPASRFVHYARLNRAILAEGAEREAELAALDHAGSPENVRATALYWLGDAAEKRSDAAAAVKWYGKSAAVSKTNEVSRLSMLRAASILSFSENEAERRRAQGMYLDLSFSESAQVKSEAIFYTAMLSYRQGRYLEAARMFARLAAECAGSAREVESRIYAAWANHLCGRHAEALTLAAALRDKGDEDAFYIVAAALAALERPQDALDAYDRALAQFPKGRHADAEWFGRVAALAAMSRHADVVAAVESRPSPPEESAQRAWSYACDAAIAMTNYTKAIRFGKLIGQRKDANLAPEAVHRLAWLHEKTGDWGKASRFYRELAKKWPEHPVAAQSRYMAGVAALKAGDAEAACGDWTAMLAEHPGSPYAREALWARAMEELRAKKFRQAGNTLGEMLKRFPDAPKKAEALYWTGVAASETGDGAAAEERLRGCLAADPPEEFAREAKLELASVLRKKGKDAEAANLYAGLLGTKTAGRMTAEALEWTAETLIATTNYASASAAAEALAGRGENPQRNQSGWALAGAAHEGMDRRDAAREAYLKALAEDARTARGAAAALALGRQETEDGLFDEAREHLENAVERAKGKDMLHLRVRAYAALAENEEARGAGDAALGYHLMVGTLFDDPEVTPQSLARAAAILRGRGKAGDAAEAESLENELAKRYPGYAAGKNAKE